MVEDIQQIGFASANPTINIEALVAPPPKGTEQAIPVYQFLMQTIQLLHYGQLPEFGLMALMPEIFAVVLAGFHPSHPRDINVKN